MKPILKPLPTTPTKKEIKQMFPLQNKEELIRWVNEIIQQNRKSKASKHIRILFTKEFCLLLEITGIPEGYTDTFNDGMTLIEKLNRIKL